MFLMKNALIRILIEYDSFVSVIRDLTNGAILPKRAELSLDNVAEFLRKHPLISLLELQHAFDFQNIDEVKNFIAPLLCERHNLIDNFITSE